MVSCTWNKYSPATLAVMLWSSINSIYKCIFWLRTTTSIYSVFIFHHDPYNLRSSFFSYFSKTITSEVIPLQLGIRAVLYCKAPFCQFFRDTPRRQLHSPTNRLKNTIVVDSSFGLRHVLLGFGCVVQM
jgi:hypothetical protein